MVLTLSLLNCVCRRLNHEANISTTLAFGKGGSLNTLEFYCPHQLDDQSNTTSTECLQFPDCFGSYLNTMLGPAMSLSMTQHQQHHHKLMANQKGRYFQQRASGTEFETAVSEWQNRERTLSYWHSFRASQLESIDRYVVGSRIFHESYTFFDNRRLWQLRDVCANQHTIKVLSLGLGAGVLQRYLLDAPFPCLQVITVELHAELAQGPFAQVLGSDTTICGTYFNISEALVGNLTHDEDGNERVCRSRVIIGDAFEIVDTLASRIDDDSSSVLACETSTATATAEGGNHYQQCTQKARHVGTDDEDPYFDIIFSDVFESDVLGWSGAAGEGNSNAQGTVGGGSKNIRNLWKLLRPRTDDIMMESLAILHVHNDSVLVHYRNSLEQVFGGGEGGGLGSSKSSHVAELAADTSAVVFVAAKNGFVHPSSTPESPQSWHPCDDIDLFMENSVGFGKNVGYTPSVTYAALFDLRCDS